MVQWGHNLSIYRRLNITAMMTMLMKMMWKTRSPLYQLRRESGSLSIVLILTPFRGQSLILTLKRYDFMSFWPTNAEIMYLVGKILAQFSTFQPEYLDLYCYISTKFMIENAGIVIVIEFYGKFNEILASRVIFYRVWIFEAATTYIYTQIRYRCARFHCPIWMFTPALCAGSTFKVIIIVYYHINFTVSNH